MKAGLTGAQTLDLLASLHPEGGAQVDPRHRAEVCERLGGMRE